MSATRLAISDVLLDRYLAGDLSGAQRAELEITIAASPELRERLEARRGELAEFLTNDPPARFAHRVAVSVAARTPQRRPLASLRYWLAPAGVLATGVLVTIVMTRPENEASAQVDDFRQVMYCCFAERGG